MKQNGLFSQDFYPTPDNLIDKMLSKIDIRNHKNILDPSCGKGDILRYTKEKYKYIYGLIYYGIEIEYQLREIAKQYCNIIGFDFLDFKSYINIDLILANFPFSEGDKHFIKAWEVLDKGEMICILNAETIKNPYSQTRKLVKKIIEDNKAEVEYIENAFIDAERKTNVEIALIHIKKEKSKTDNFFADIEKEYINMYNGLIGNISDTEILKGNNKTDHLVALCEILKREYAQVYLSLEKFNYYINKIHNNESIYFTKYLFPETVNLNEGILQINRKFWEKWFQDTDIRSKITSKVYEDFLKDYQNSQLDFNHKNIGIVIDIIVGNSGKIQEDNINTVFDIFTKYYPNNRVYIEGWAHNSAWMIGKTVILPNMVDLDWNNNIIGISNKEIARDIDKVFCSLTGQNYNNIKKLEDACYTGYETTFFNVKLYKKGTLHLTFKDTELVKQFNLEVCKYKKWLTPNDFKYKAK